MIFLELLILCLDSIDGFMGLETGRLADWEERVVDEVNRREWFLQEIGGASCWLEEVWSLCFDNNTIGAEKGNIFWSAFLP